MDSAERHCATYPIAQNGKDANTLFTKTKPHLGAIIAEPLCTRHLTPYTLAAREDLGQCIIQ